MPGATGQGRAALDSAYKGLVPVGTAPVGKVPTPPAASIPRDGMGRVRGTSTALHTVGTETAAVRSAGIEHISYPASGVNTRPRRQSSRRHKH